MGIVFRAGTMVTEQNLVPVEEIMDYLCETRNMARITCKYPVHPDTVLESVIAYNAANECLFDKHIEFAAFDLDQIAQEASLETTGISQNQFLNVLEYGMACVGENQTNTEIDQLYQIGLFYMMIDVLEDISETGDLDKNRGYAHYVVHLALADAYQGDLSLDAAALLEQITEDF